VLVDGDDVVSDSPLVLEWLERRHPEPPLYPREPARRAEVQVFVDWFNQLWKRPPNLIAVELEGPNPDARRIEELGSRMRASLDVFERLLEGRDYLYGEFGVADVVAFPFLKYAVFGLPPEDDEVFPPGPRRAHAARRWVPAATWLVGARRRAPSQLA